MESLFLSDFKQNMLYPPYEPFNQIQSICKQIQSTVTQLENGLDEEQSFENLQGMALSLVGTVRNLETNSFPIDDMSEMASSNPAPTVPTPDSGEKRAKVSETRYKRQVPLSSAQIQNPSPFRSIFGSCGDFRSLDNSRSLLNMSCPDFMKLPSADFDGGPVEFPPRRPYKRPPNPIIRPIPRCSSPNYSTFPLPIYASPQEPFSFSSSVGTSFSPVSDNQVAEALESSSPSPSPRDDADSPSSSPTRKKVHPREHRMKRRVQRLRRIEKKMQQNPGLKCYECGATETPEWRRGPKGPNTLCNACGIRYSKQARGLPN